MTWGGGGVGHICVAIQSLVKKKDRTDMRIHAFRQTVEYYKHNASPICICYLDGIMPFHRLIHWLLFMKLLCHHIPLHIVRLPVWSQRFNIQWGGCSSMVSLLQFGILSQWIFNINVYDVVVSHSNVNAGIDFVWMYGNHACWWHYDHP